MDDDYERILSVKNEVFVYKIPPRQSSRGYRAADWKLDQPDWTGRLRIVLLNNRCFLKLEDKTSGELFAQAPVDQYPGPSVEAVTDSSRYFVIKVVDENGRHAFIGIGFADRGDSFDFNVSLQDHFKREILEDKMAHSEITPLDLRFKEGETIKINIGNKAGQEVKARPKKGAGSAGILPPPPSGGLFQSSPASISTTIQPAKPQQVSSKSDLISNQKPETVWGDFESFSNSNSSSSESTGWVQF